LSGSKQRAVREKIRWVKNRRTHSVLFQELQCLPGQTLAVTFNRLRAKLWQDWIEFQDSNDECHRFADAIGFRYCEEGLALLEKDYSAFEKWTRNLTG
jgi:hypothetical protein